MTDARVNLRGGGGGVDSKRSFNALMAAHLSRADDGD